MLARRPRPLATKRCVPGYVDGVHSSLRAGLVDMRALTLCFVQGELATIGTTMQTTAILEAGRISLDSGNRTVKILYEDDKAIQPCGLK